MSGSRRSSRGIGEYGGEYRSTSSRPTSGRLPATGSYSAYEYGTAAGQQYDPAYGAGQYGVQYGSQYDTGYSRGGYDTTGSSRTGYDSGYPRADDYSTRAAYDEYVSGYGREELLSRAMEGNMYSDLHGGGGARPTSSFNPYAEIGQSRGAGSVTSGGSKPSRPTSAKPPSKSKEKEKSSSFNLFGKGKNKTSTSSSSRLHGTDKQKPTPSRYDAYAIH